MSNIMKIGTKVLAVAAMVAAALTTGVTSASAQSIDGWEIGGRMSIYSRWNGAVGVGVYGRHDLGSDFRIEPSFMILCERGMSVDMSAVVHYPIYLSQGFEVYPLAGLSLNDPGKFGLGVNFGAGAGYEITNRMNLDFGIKWVAQTQDFVRNPMVISLGCGYRF